MATFSVLIVGGSIAGLALANMLERYGIGYTLIEKHANIAPELGAMIGLLPNSARILDQLGCYDRLLTLGVPINCMRSFGPDGAPLAESKNGGRYLEETLGYKFWRFDRQQLVQVLYDHVLDKSKIHTSSGAFRVEHLEDGVRVETQDGRVFTGSILVGADGVHSRIRQEMWRIADSDMTGSFFAKDQKAILESSYSCIFGISKNIEHEFTDGWYSYHQGRHYLCQREDNGRTYWFFFFKNSNYIQDSYPPHYTEEDRDIIAAQYETDMLMPNLSFGQLYDQRIRAVLLPLEEYVLKQCYYRRILLLGDSFHKFHPLTSQGGSSAIEASAYLANKLKDMLNYGAISDEKLQSLFARLQEDQCPKAESRMRDGHLLARLQSLDNTFFRFLLLHVMARLPEESALPLFAETCSTEIRLKYLPPPSKKGMVPFGDEISIRPRNRQTTSTFSWMLPFVLIAAAQFLFRGPDAGEWDGPEGYPGSKAYSLTQAYFTIYTMTINGLWCLESYRNKFGMTPIGSTIPIILLYLISGSNIAIAMPLYFALHIWFSRRAEFYYPAPRTIPLCVAQALPIALVVTYLTATLAIPHTTSLGEAARNSTAVSVMGFELSAWSAAHACFPAAVAFITEILNRSTDAARGPKSVWGDADIPYISVFLGFISFAASTFHILYVTNMTSFVARLLGREVAPLDFVALRVGMQLDGQGLGLVLWLFYTVWELQRIRATDVSWIRATLCFITGTFLAGPASCLAAVWCWREVTLERARARMPTQAQTKVSQKSLKRPNRGWGVR